MKKLFATLVLSLGVITTAQAQSSVSVYGLFDGGYNGKVTETKTAAGAVSTVSNSDFSGGQAASSRIGFRGVEALGGGLNATFNLELGFEPGSGTLQTTTVPGLAGQSQADGVRTSTIGLQSSKWGTVNIGRQFSGMHGIVAGSIFTGNNMVGDIVYASFTNSNGTAGRVSQNVTRFNGLAYTSPTVSGFTARVDYSNSRATGAATASSSQAEASNTSALQVGNVGFRADYTHGPFRLSAGTHKVTSTNGNVSSTTGAVSETTINAVGAVYNNKGLIANLTYAQNKSITSGAQTGAVSATKLGVSYAVTPVITPFVQVGVGKSETTVDTNPNNNFGYQAGTTYAMSKRTNLYAVYGYQKSVNPSSTAAIEAREVGVGVVHTF
jgi:predicted porin